MPRRKKRRCCREYRGLEIFKPLGIPMRDLEVVALEHDEFEAMRLCDKENLTQEEAGNRMGVSRGTIQRLLNTGRLKLIDFILNGYALKIVPISNHPY